MWAIAIRFFTSRVGIAAVGLVATVASYNVGSWQGERAGRDAARIEQLKANDEAREVIRERIRNALDDAGADDSPDAVDRLLEGLSGLD